MHNSYLLIIFALMVNLPGLSQTHHQDTTFLVRENDLYYHAIFIERDTSSLLYDAVATNRMSPWDSAFYFGGIKLLKEKTKITRHGITDISNSWHPLYWYKGEYYVYFPSCGGHNEWVSINDSIFLHYAHGEMISKAINRFEKVTDRQYLITATSFTVKSGQIRIHLIDLVKGIALFEYPDELPEHRYVLMVATPKVKNFPLVVNYCKEEMQAEFEFDKPDYQKLIKSSSQH